MATFKLVDGEQVIHRERVSMPSENVQVPAELVLTNLRIVLHGESGSSFRWAIGVGAVLGVLLRGLSKSRGVLEQIALEDFAEAEVRGKGALRVRSKGEGYGAFWFDAFVKRPEAWVDRLHRWGAGTLSDAELPAARVVER